MILRVVKERDVDAIELQALETLGNRAADALGAEVEDHSSAGAPTKCGLGFPGFRRRPTFVETVYSSRGRPGQCFAEALLGQARAVERRRVE